jgi:hypothetical protein
MIMMWESKETYLMRTLLIISVLSLAMAGCGSPSSSTRQSTDIGPEAGAGGEDVVAPSGGTETGGASGETGGTGGYDPTGGTGNDVATGGQDVGTGGQDVGTGGAGTGGEPVATGGAGTGGDAAGGTGNVGGGCEPWDCTNIAIQLAGWDSASGDPVPEACGLVQDPCTGMMVDCGGCSGYMAGCGIGTAYMEDEVNGIEWINPIDNVCGTGCVEVSDPNATQCHSEDYAFDDFAVMCGEFVDSNLPPYQDCVQYGLFGWCCDY